VRWPPVWELVSWSNASVVGYSPAGKDVSKGRCKDPLPENDYLRHIRLYVCCSYSEL
jgi:hypothetical protein